jgi:hypothetical protein
MSTIVTRATKGTPLTWTELDANFTNLNTDKYEQGDTPYFGATMQLNGALQSWDTVTYTTIFQVGSSGIVATSTTLRHLQNCYIASGGTYKYVNAGSASEIQQGGSQIGFYAADSGLAGGTVTMNLMGYMDGYQNLWYNHTGRLQFPSTQNASSDANTLDDYEEGTWTPTDASGAGLSFAVAGGRYIKIGKMVHIQFNVLYPATADASSAKIGSLPFTSVSSAYRAALVKGYDMAANPTSGLVDTNAVTASLYAGTGFATNAQCSSKDLYFSTTYEASA